MGRWKWTKAGDDVVDLDPGREAMSGEWIKATPGEATETEIWNLDGVWWYAAPLPPRIHRCRTQTKGWSGYFSWAERCACGALRYGSDRPWINRNDRKAT